MNQPLNYIVNDTRYFYNLDTSQWYVINKDKSITYVTEQTRFVM